MDLADWQARYSDEHNQTYTVQGVQVAWEWTPRGTLLALQAYTLSTGSEKLDKLRRVPGGITK